MGFLKEANGLFIGNFNETVKEEGKYFKVGVMFSTGTHRGVEYTREDIQQLAESFDSEDFVPVQIDHSESARDTVGYIREVYAEGNNLMGKLEIIDEEAQQRIDKGLMKKLSVSFYLKEIANKVKPFKIREVSLVAFPQVKGAQLFSETSGSKLTKEQMARLAELWSKYKDGLSLNEQEIKDFQNLFGLLLAEGEEKTEKESKSESKRDNFHEGQTLDEFYEEYSKKHGHGQGYYDQLKLKEIREEAQKRERKEFSVEEPEETGRSEYEKFNNVDEMYEAYAKKFGNSL
ncbi:DUF2213 domain-containing protein [Priestia megaterium]|uniref:DUF2213 domain-containing protein n=1 Tax=Priestia megaterium TaxID=1404 RepID=UPI00300906B4